MKKSLFYSQILFLVILVNSFSISFWDTFPGTYLASFVNFLYILKKLLCCIIVISIPLNNRNCTPIFLSIVIGAILYLSTYLFFPKNAVLLEPIEMDFLFSILAFVVTLTIDIGTEKLIRFLLIASRISFMITIYAVVFYIGPDLMNYLSKNYMFLANALICSVAFLIYGMIVYKRIVDTMLSILGIVLIFLGSRGAFLSILILISMLAYQNKYFTLKNVFFLLFSFGVFLLFYDHLLGGLGVDFSNSRVFSFMNNSSYNYKEEDRFEIWNIICDRAAGNYYLPGGLCADRLYLNEAFNTFGSHVYAHNFFVEMLADFGIVGLVVALSIFLLFFYYLFSNKFSIISKSYLSVLFCISLFQLLFSRTFIREYNLFVFLAVLYLSINNEWRNERKSICNNSNIQEW